MTGESSSMKEGFAKMFGKIVLTALVSGVIGASITWEVDRASPSLTLISVGFRGPLNIDTIDIGDEISTLTSQTGMLASLKRFESFEKLSATEQQAGEALVLLEESINAVEAWRKRYALPSTDGQLRRLPLQAVLDHPFASDDLVGGTIMSLLREGKLGSPPSRIELLRDLPPVLPFGEVKKDVWILVYGKRQSKFSGADNLPDVRNGIHLLASSFAVGAYDNIDFYSEKFVEESRREIALVRKISDLIRDVILPNAVISARVLIENRGGKAITFNPNFALRFEDQSLGIEPIILRASPLREPKRMNPFSLSADGGFSISIPNDEQEGKMARVEPFLPDPDAYPYINIPPGELKEVSVTGSSPLGGITKDLLTIYQSKLLRVSVSGSTAAGSLYESRTASFSERIGEVEKRLLQGGK